MEKDFTQTEGFWIRLQDFVKDVQVNDPMSDEEKDMILWNCKEQLAKFEDIKWANSQGQ